MGDGGGGHTGYFEIAEGATVVEVEEVEHAAHGFGPGLHPAGPFDGMALGYALLFEPGGVERLKLGFAEGVVLDDGFAWDARYGEEEGHDDAGAVFATMTVDDDSALSHGG